MVTTEIGNHTVEYYDAIDELPIVRYHKYQKMLLIDAGVGSDITAFDHRIEKARRHLMAGEPEKAQTELDNLRQCVYMIQSGLNVRHLAFAALVKRIDGKLYDDLTDESLHEVCKLLSDSPNGALAAEIEAVKKKIDAELMLYFPAMFNDSAVKEYFDILRRRTMALLDGIAAGVEDPERSGDVEKLTTALITYSHPKVFSGPGSEEIVFDRNFEDMCLVLSEQLHVEPKKYTVLEFYNAFDFVKKRAKQAETAQKRPNSR